jgi:hypothetical protein
MSLTRVISRVHAVLVDPEEERNMEAFENTVTIARSPDEVFDFLAHFENVPAWNHAIQSTRQVSPGPVGVGTVYLQIRSEPRWADEGFVVTTLDPPRRLAIEGDLGPFHARLRYVLEPVNDYTELTNEVELMPASAVAKVLAPLASYKIKAAVASNLIELKRILQTKDRARLGSA